MRNTQESPNDARSFGTHPCQGYEEDCRDRRIGERHFATAADREWRCIEWYAVEKGLRAGTKHSKVEMEGRLPARSDVQPQ